MQTTLPAPLAPKLQPVQLSVQHEGQQSRLTNFPLGVGTFLRTLLLIPHMIILYLFQIVVGVLYFIAAIAILFSGRYPRGLFVLAVGYLRWSANTSGYMSSLYDKYPPFTPDVVEFPLALSIVYPERSSRVLNFPVLGVVIKAVLLLPHYFVTLWLAVFAFVLVFIAKFCILATGRYPRSLHAFVAGTIRYQTRVTAYTSGLTDRYPPFSLQS